jgi:spermidine synthase
MKPNTRFPLALFACAALLFTLSGGTALVYQSVLNKLFSYVFGVSAYAAATVLAAFMLGLALGSYLLGRLSSGRIRRHLLWYGLLELLVGLYGLVLLPMTGAIERLYTDLARELQWSLNLLTGLRFVAALVIVGIPTTLMGGSLPLLAEGVKRRGAGGHVNVLYTLNIVGACVGVVGASYVLFPSLHLDGSLRLVCAINALVCAVAALLEFVVPPLPATPVVAVRAGDGPPMAVAYAYPLAFYSGLMVFAGEVFWYHVLTLIVGSTIYAYAIMLFTTLLGMALAGFLVQRLPPRQGAGYLHLIALSQLVLGLAGFALLPLWDHVPALFLQLGLFIRSFAGMEVGRFVACCALILIPATAAGFTFPVLLRATEAAAADVGAAIGRLYAVNTLGTIVGSLAAGFVVLPWLGGRGALIASAGMALVAAGILWSPGRRDALRYGTLGACAAVALAAVAPGWDVRVLLSGAGIYFAPTHDDFDELVWQHEDYVGGVTSVVRGGSVLTLLTNGKFQGNDGAEVKDQERFALIPNLFVKHLGNALNIGIGTGATLGMITSFPYAQIDAVELSPDIVHAARGYFGPINHGALDDPRVRVHIQDGRNFLALNRTDHLYDMVSIEISSIWFAGAGNLYNEEFYRLARANMSPDGVLQQWIQLHHMDPADVASVLKTVRGHFRYVQLWLPGHQGIIVASDRPLEVVEERMREVDALPASTFYLRDHRTVLGELLLTSDEMDDFLAATERAGAVPLSTDYNLHLEYSTPRGNALGWNFNQNFAQLVRYAKHSVETILPAAMRMDPTVRALAAVGHAHFYPEYSTPWHEQVQAGFQTLPTPELRRELKERLVAAATVQGP